MEQAVLSISGSSTLLMNRDTICHVIQSIVPLSLTSSNRQYKPEKSGLHHTIHVQWWCRGVGESISEWMTLADPEQGFK